jgi:hypothetical protein
MTLLLPALGRRHGAFASKESTMLNRTILGSAVLAVFLAAGGAAMAQEAGAPTKTPKPPAKASCLVLDENGRTIPNPNANYGCFQIEAQRNDCEALAKAGNTKGLSLHCFGFETAPQAPSAYVSSPRSERRSLQR